MIKFQLFDSTKSYQCHFAEISTFVVSISHYMRAYFNYQALNEGTNFQLPADAAYLNVSIYRIDKREKHFLDAAPTLSILHPNALVTLSFK